MIPSPFLDGVNILETIEKAGYQAYFVGGSVRDFLLKREIRDIDITTSASTEVIQSLFPKVIPVGIEHGTVIVRFNHISYEVTTFRMDGKYSDQRHPDHVEFVSNIEEDLHRRDFTINAMAMDRNGKIIDLFGGKNDLKDKNIRTVGNGFDRFREDPLRIIRALRFVSQLGLTIEQATYNNMKTVKNEIDSLAIERIKSEMTNFFAGDYIEQGILYLKSTGIYENLPIIKENPDLIHELAPPFSPLMSFGEIIAFFHFKKNKISVSQWIKAWKCSNKEKQEALELTRALDYYDKRELDQWLVYQLPNDLFPGFIRLSHNLFKSSNLNLEDLNEIAQKLPIRSQKDLNINGNDLIALFPHLKRGRWINDSLCKIEKEVVFDRLINTKTNLKEWITCNPPEINLSNY